MSECIEAVGRKNNSGYVNLYLDKRVQGAHRNAWEKANGKIPPGMVVMHACDNRSCINLEHLSIGTPRENTADMMAKGRSRYVNHPGTSNGRCKITEEDVRKIRAMIADGMASRSIAELFGVTPQNIDRIKRGLTWRHLK